MTQGVHYDFVAHLWHLCALDRLISNLVPHTIHSQTESGYAWESEERKVSRGAAGRVDLVVMAHVLFFTASPSLFSPHAS